MNEKQIIEAALKDGGMPAAQAAAYRLLLQHADRFSAMDQVSGAKSNKGEAPCATGNVNFSGPAPESGLDPRIEEISRGHDGKWRAYGRGDRGQMVHLGESANLADLVGVNDKAYIMLGELQIENSKLRAKVEALAALNVRITDERNEFETRISAIEDRDSKAICRVFDMDGKAETKHAAQVAALTKERDEALQMVEALRKDNRSVILLRDEARRARDAAQDQIAHWKGLFEAMRKSEQQSAEKLEAAQQDRYTAERTRDAAQAECNRLREEKRRLEDELANYRADAVSQFRKPTPTPAAMVRQFNRKFGVPIADVPAFPAWDRMDLRVRLIAEEFCEFLSACGCCFTVDIGKLFYQRTTFPALNLVAAADGLADLQFVIEGTALEFGIPLAAVFAEVHRSNMTKTGRADDGGGTPAGKSMKGDGYEPPQIERILREHGWEG